MNFATGLNEPEGPVLLDDGSWLVVEMGPGSGHVTHLSADGRSRRIIATTGRPNGLAIDGRNLIWVAESQHSTLLRLTFDGASEVFLADCDGVPLRFPNDLAFGPDGALYMTDTGIVISDFAPNNRIVSNWMDLPSDGKVFRIDTTTKEITLIDSGFRFTNGIAFDSEGHLYVNETFTGNVYRYRQLAASLGPRELFANVLSSPVSATLRGPDGMKFGLDGNLYVVVWGQGDVTVLDPQGNVIRRIPTPGKMPTNIAFGPPHSRMFYVTEIETGALVAFAADTDGLPLHMGLID